MHIGIYGANNLNFVEFNLTGDMETIQRCDRDSLYLNTEVFNLFSECFENSNNLYDYFGPNKYNSRNIVVLLNELNTNLYHLVGIKSYTEFSDFVTSKFLGTTFLNELEGENVDWADDWNIYKLMLIEINERLLSLVNDCIERERILWLIGY